MGLRKGVWLIGVCLLFGGTLQAQNVSSSDSSIGTNSQPVNGVYMYFYPYDVRWFEFTPDGTFNYVRFTCTETPSGKGTWERKGDSLVLTAPPAPYYPPSEVLAAVTIPEANKAYDKIQITVIDENGNPLPGVEVCFKDRDSVCENCRTDAKGRFEYNLVAGEESVKIRLFRGGG